MPLRIEVLEEAQHLITNDRNKDLWLIAKLKPAYNIEKAIQERKRYHAKKVKANA